MFSRREIDSQRDRVASKSFDEAEAMLISRDGEDRVARPSKPRGSDSGFGGLVLRYCEMILATIVVAVIVVAGTVRGRSAGQTGPGDHVTDAQPASAVQA